LCSVSCFPPAEAANKSCTVKDSQVSGPESIFPGSTLVSHLSQIIVKGIMVLHKEKLKDCEREKFEMCKHEQKKPFSSWIIITDEMYDFQLVTALGGFKTVTYESVF
jgi:hypothetical protein